MPSRLRSGEKRSTQGPATDRAVDETVARLGEKLRLTGVLLFSDPTRPSVVQEIVGTAVPGSWWSHPAGGRIYAVGQALEDRTDVVTVPLVDRKATLVHRRLWPELVALGGSREPWQLEGLSPSGRDLLASVDRHEVDLDRHPRLALPDHRTMGDLARDLERRLLVVGASVHSPSGRHVKHLTSWKRWAAQRRLPVQRPSIPVARAILETTIGAVYPPRGRRAPWPWPSRSPGSDGGVDS